MAAAGVAGVLFAFTGASASGTEVSRAEVGEVIEVHDNYFDPRSLSIDRGDSVRWVWRGENRHNVRFVRTPRRAARKHIRARSEGGVTRTLNVPGRYRYICTFYEGMQGLVTVTPSR
jgi:plastocyanin